MTLRPVSVLLEHTFVHSYAWRCRRSVPRCEELEDQVAALKGAAGFYWALWQEVQHLLAHLPRPGRRGSPYSIWYEGPRADALRGHHTDFARRICPTCRTAVLSLFRLPRRYEDNRPVCSACYLELVAPSAIAPW